MKLPNKWGKGIIFAFSGFDGRTDWFRPFVASTDQQPGSFHFHIPGECKLYFSGRALKNRKTDIVASDVVIFSSPRISMTFLDCETIVGECESSVIPGIEGGPEVKQTREGCAVIQEHPEAYTVLLTKQASAGMTRFAFAFDGTGPDRAFQKARRGLKSDIGSVIAERCGFYFRVVAPRFHGAISERTYYKAISVMKVNVESSCGKIESTWTTPDRYPHRDMWFWDSAFHSFGNRFISPALAEATIWAVLQLTRDDGFISISMNPEKGRVEEQITQPPLMAWASWDLYRYTGDKDFLKRVYPKIASHLLWVYVNRDKDGDGLLEWTIGENPICKCGESGMDNSPRFDTCDAGEPVAAIDYNCFAINEIEHLGLIADAIGDNEGNNRWKKLRAEKVELVNRLLWDPSHKFYFDRKKDGSFIRVMTPASLLPMFAGVASKERARYLMRRIRSTKKFATRFPVPSVARDEKTFSRDMWRGSTWINYNYLVICGLRRYGYFHRARTIAAATCREIERWYRKEGAIFEFYDTDGKIPPGNLPRKDWLGTPGWTRVITDYHWSAAIYVALMNDKLRYKKGYKNV
jgi:glycogen debranching enzyme